MKISHGLRTLALITACLTLATFGLASSAGSALGQSSLTGTATDASDGSALVGATVTVTATDQSNDPVLRKTGDDGSFTIPVPESGEYSLTVSYIGYASWTVQGSDMTGGALETALTPITINLGAMTVTTSRRPEKILDAPAAISTMGKEEIEANASLSVTDHMKNLPGVDVVSTGLNSSNVVVRGFNNIFSTTLLTFVDNRLARVPSLRVNVNQFIPTADEDIEQIEIVAGPASALYGPNAANGVLHIITKSPLASPGTRISMATGERNLRMVSFRHARSINGKFGYKVSGKFYRATDWESEDDAEPEFITLFRQSDTGNIPVTGVILNERNFEIEKMSLDARADWAINENTMLIFNAGANQSSNIELTGLGAGEADDWILGYGQTRFTYKDFFAQLFVNGSDAGETYIRRSGAKIIDESRLYVGQLQHSYTATDKLSLTYGFDALLTRPNTGGTINGANEENDDINEYGAYLQATYQLTDKWKLIGAGRIDDHNLLTEAVFSPRGAIVFQPDDRQTFRFTANQAYSTPSSLNFYLNVLSGSLATADVNSSLIPFIGPTIFNVLGSGSKDGFTFSYGNDGRPQMLSLYGPSLGVADGYLDANVASIWPALAALAGPSFPGVNMPATLSGPAPGQYLGLNTVTQGFDPFDPANVVNLDPIRETKTTTFEMGYKGVVNNRLAVSINGYYSEIKDHVGPLALETPHVFINPVTFIPVLRDDLILANPGMDAATATAIATGIATQFGQLPIGLVSPLEDSSATDILITYRNFGNIDLLGADIALNYHINQSWDVGGTYTFLQENLFENVDGIADIPVNAPKNKFTLTAKYTNSRTGFSAQVKYRFIDKFPVQSGVFNGEIDRYGLLDLNLMYRIDNRGSIGLTIKNALDNMHQEFIGAPIMGRMTILRMTHDVF